MSINNEVCENEGIRYQCFQYLREDLRWYVLPYTCINNFIHLSKLVFEFSNRQEINKINVSGQSFKLVSFAQLKSVFLGRPLFGFYRLSHWRGHHGEVIVLEISKTEVHFTRMSLSL